MRKSTLVRNPIVAVLREGERVVPLVEILRKHGLSQQTFYCAGALNCPLCVNGPTPAAINGAFTERSVRVRRA